MEKKPVVRPEVPAAGTAEEPAAAAAEPVSAGPEPKAAEPEVPVVVANTVVGLSLDIEEHHRGALPHPRMVVLLPQKESSLNMVVAVQILSAETEVAEFPAGAETQKHQKQQLPLFLRRTVRGRKKTFKKSCSLGEET